MQLEGKMLESIQLDQEILLDAGAQLHRLKMYPYFDIAHYLLMIIEVRDELGNAASIFSRKHPLSCWLSSMLMCFADAFLANFLLGEPLIAPFKRHDDIVLATLVWYFVFYAPFDGIYKLAKVMPVKCVLSVLKEVKRAYKVSHGVSHAAKLYPNSYLVQILVGTAKGAGSGIVRTLEQLVRGVWVPTHNEVLRPTFATKACVIASTVLAMEKSSSYITAPHDLIYLVSPWKSLKTIIWLCWSSSASSCTSNCRPSSCTSPTHSRPSRTCSAPSSWVAFGMPCQGLWLHRVTDEQGQQTKTERFPAERKRISSFFAPLRPLIVAHYSNNCEKYFEIFRFVFIHIFSLSNLLRIFRARFNNPRVFGRSALFFFYFLNFFVKSLWTNKPNFI